MLLQYIPCTDVLIISNTIARLCFNICSAFVGLGFLKCNVQFREQKAQEKK